MPKKTHGMTIIVKTISRLTLGFILLYGVYIGLSGHLSPGGGFVGGVIIALSFVHIMLAFGKEVALKRLHSRNLRVAINLGALIFLCLVIAGFAGASSGTHRFFGSIRPYEVFHSEIVLPVCEMVIVGAGLFAMFTALVLLPKSGGTKEAE